MTNPVLEFCGQDRDRRKREQQALRIAMFAADRTPALAARGNPGLSAVDPFSSRTQSQATLFFG